MSSSAWGPTCWRSRRAAAVVLAGNPVTRARLEDAGARSDRIRRREISLKGGGGPTCLTRPLMRLDPAADL